VKISAFIKIPMSFHAPHDPTPYDDDWEDQPAQSGFHKWFAGIAVPLFMIVLGVRGLMQHEITLSEYGGFHGPSAIAVCIAIFGGSVFVHCHYFWGNIYNHAWFAVLGKIVSAIVLIGALIFLLIRNGILGKT
jgi:hypothetical protein